MLYRQWTLRQTEPDISDALCRDTGADRLLCRVLAARGVDTPAAMARLLSTDDTLPDPMSLRDMDRAVARICRAIQEDEAIVVFGDYDVDGITATALLYTWLENQGAQVFYKLPSRSDDDYGLTPALVDQMADKGIGLIITVDNGTTAFEAIERAAERGVSVVVTDHHLPYDTLPPAEAVVNPCRADDESGMHRLSGAGVAFMLLAALEGCPAEELLPIFGDLAAIGTVADVMKLTDENRTLVRAGLAALQDTERPGLRALIEACGWGDKPVSVENVSYGIAPRLNAAGRMDDATAALQLLLAEDEEEAQLLVDGLQQQNAARQKAEQEILDLIAEQFEQSPELQSARVLVIWGEGWHQGVIGIVASRLVERYAKPAIVITFEGDEGKGSGRSVAGFSLHGAIASCGDILIRYGGHDLAAGFSIERGNAEEFRRRINAWAAENDPAPALPEIWADVAVTLEELTVAAVAGLDALAPCGSGNPAPRFLLQGAVIDGVYPVSEGRHSRLRLKQGGGSVYAVLFGTGPGRLAYRPGDTVDLLVSLSVYEGKQGAQVSARILELRPAGMGDTHAVQSTLFTHFTVGGRLDAEQRAKLTPERDDTAAVYRLVREGGVNSEDLRPLFARLGEEQTGRILASLAALEELGLIEQDAATGCYRPVVVQERRDLAASVLLQRLRAATA